MTNVPYHQITKAGLIEIAERLNITLPAKVTKLQIIEAIENYHYAIEEYFLQDSCA